MVAVGEDVADIQPGERVMAIVVGGAYADYARVDRGMAVRIPDRLGDAEAGIHRFAEGALPMFADGRLRPLVGRTFPLAEAALAHRCMEAGGGFGKIVLTMAT